MELPGNVDAREIERFDQIARVWWDSQGQMGTLHTINPLRLRFITKNINLADQKILDVGCGGGILTEALAKEGARVTGIDLSQASITVAVRHARSQGLQIEYLNTSIEELSLEYPGRFDIVTCMEMIEHVPVPQNVIAGCEKALKPGGLAYFSTINRTFKALVFAIVMGEYVLHLLPQGSHKYQRLIKPSELKMWAEKSGLTYMRLASLMYHPMTKKFSLDENREDINYLAQFIKRN